MNYKGISLLTDCVMISLMVVIPMWKEPCVLRQVTKQGEIYSSGQCRKYFYLFRVFICFALVEMMKKLYKELFIAQTIY